MNKEKILGIASAMLLGAVTAQYAYAADDTGAAITSAELTTPTTVFPTDLVSGASQTQLANYAWRLFIASMQQTSATLQSGAGRGVGDGKHNFIQTGATPAVDNPLVFESFYHRTEAFPYYTTSKPASPINALPTYYTFYEDASDNKQALTVKGQNYVYLDETNQISQNLLYYKNSHNPDFPVLFMAKVNQQETEYALSSDREPPSASKSWDFPDGVVEVKSAWRRVSDIKNSDTNKYHQASATYFVSDGENAPVAHTATFALIAIHIIQKTANYPEFIFTTFEHVDAVTRNSSQAITDPAYKTEYNNLSYQTPDTDPHTATANGAYYINEQGQSGKPNKLSTYTLPSKGTISQDYTTVVQPNTIISEVNDVNNQVNALVQGLDSDNVWGNYRLKGVQAVPTSDSDTSNYYLANIVVESSQPGIQLFSGVLLNGGVPQAGTTTATKDVLYFVNCRGDKGSSTCVYPTESGLSNSSAPSTYNNVSLGVTQDAAVPAPKYNMGGCQGCHGAAQQLGRDFSFLANGVGGKGKELDSVAASDLSLEAIDAHNTKMIQSSGFDL
ncbi:hypothetical protein [Thalassomonas actiniarum]|uniref:Cytochrome c domain-containing protein n=1 Tax=Thalassomonas actiniarum TaxID=485447 RepID=A0AAF0C5K5_9GAMM|nr:hypothetical protein [Thalassomonas actiniarum]WDE00960.1 hypothetical protein SG35_010200 [Thalassomonas actiniarum]